MQDLATTAVIHPPCWMDDGINMVAKFRELYWTSVCLKRYSQLWPAQGLQQSPIFDLICFVGFVVIRVPFLCSTWVTLFPILTRSGSATHKIVLSVQIFSHTSIDGKTRSIRERHQVTYLQQSHFRRSSLHWEVSQSPTDFKKAWLLRDWQRKLRDCWIFSLSFL